MWDENCQNSFDKLKCSLVVSPVLSYPNRNGVFILDTDASSTGLGAVLSQLQEGQEKVIAYASRTLNKSQQKYCTTHKELLAFVTFIKHFRHYLLGRKFMVRTDHAALKWLRNFKEPEGMIARWLSVLETYDFEISHRRGSLHGNADGMSRIPPRKCMRDDCPDCQNRNVHVAMKAKIHSAESSTNPKTEQNETVHIAPVMMTDRNLSNVPNWLENFTSTDIAEMQQNDPVLHEILNLKTQYTNKPPRHKLEEFDIEVKTLCTMWNSLFIDSDGILYRKIQGQIDTEQTQLVVPSVLRQKILEHFHNS